MIIIVLMVACYLVWRKSWLPGGFADFKNTILEARMVKDDLNSMLEKSLDVSREIVTSIDNRLNQIEEEERVLEDEELTMELPDSSPIQPKAKIRVYELARSLGMNSRDLINRMQVAGYSYNNPLNTIDEVTAGIIIDRMNSLDENEHNNFIQIQDQSPAEITGHENQLAIAEPLNLVNSVTNDNPLEIDDLQALEAWVESLKEAHPYVAVKALADKGYSIRAIAKLLERGQGEVSLILNLVNKKRACM